MSAIHPDQETSAAAHVTLQLTIDSARGPLGEDHHSGNVDDVYRIVTSGRYRRSALTEYSKRDLRDKIVNGLSRQDPLCFTVPFGCYKSWRVLSHPRPNWAEIFSLSYVHSFIESVSDVYPYGVEVDFTHVPGVMDLVSNHDPAWEPAYIEGFRALCDAFSTETARMNLVELGTDYQRPADLRESLERRYREIEPEWNLQIDDDSHARKLASAARNLAPVGADDLSHSSDSDWAALVRKSAIMCDALDSMPERRAYNKYSHRIQIVFIRGPEPSIHLGTTETSVSQFWISEAVLERRRDRMLRRLVGHTSLESELNGRSWWMDCSDLDFPAGVAEKCQVDKCLILKPEEDS